MIIISSRKFRDSQNEYFQKALKEDVILTTLKFGSFRLVPIIEGEPRQEIKDSSMEKGHEERPESVNRAIEEKQKEVRKARIISDYSPVETISEEREAVIETKSGRDEIMIENNMVPNNGTREIIDDGDEILVPKPNESEEKMVPNMNSSEKQSVFVDPALYDTNPREYAKELEEERKMIEELRYKGIRKIIHNLGKKNK